VLPSIIDYNSYIALGSSSDTHNTLPPIRLSILIVKIEPFPDDVSDQTLRSRMDHCQPVYGAKTHLSGTVPSSDLVCVCAARPVARKSSVVDRPLFPVGTKEATVRLGPWERLQLRDVVHLENVVEIIFCAHQFSRL